jgi:hypothetical protein
MTTTGTIDITNTVASIKDTFVTSATAYIYGLEVAAVPEIGLPIISQLDQAAVKEMLTLLTKWAVMEGFFINTAIRKASQAQDYVNAKAAKEALPITATKEQYAQAEAAEIQSFSNFVQLDN